MVAMFKESETLELKKRARQLIVRPDVTVNVPERLASLTRLISGNNRISALELSKRLQVAEKTIKRDLKKLKQKGAIKRVGPDKGGRLVVLEKAGGDEK